MIGSWPSFAEDVAAARELQELDETGKFPTDERIQRIKECSEFAAGIVLAQNLTTIESMALSEGTYSLEEVVASYRGVGLAYLDVILSATRSENEQ